MFIDLSTFRDSIKYWFQIQRFSAITGTYWYMRKFLNISLKGGTISQTANQPKLCIARRQMERKILLRKTAEVNGVRITYTLL